MNVKLLISILSIALLMTIGCNRNKSPTSSCEMKFPNQLTSSEKDYIPYISPNGVTIAFLSARNTYNINAVSIILEEGYDHAENSF